MAIINKKDAKKQSITYKQADKKMKKNIVIYSLYSTLIVLSITIFASYFTNNNQSHAEENVITVYKSSTCGCCKNWIAHLENSSLVKEMGFKVKAIDSSNMTLIKDKLAVPSKARSCHTAVINDYVIEGHVPASDIKKLLIEKRDITGLAVPGMPMGSPGMEGGRVDKYLVYEFDKNGKSKVIKQY